MAITNKLTNSYFALAILINFELFTNVNVISVVCFYVCVLCVCPKNIGNFVNCHIMWRVACLHLMYPIFGVTAFFTKIWTIFRDNLKNGDQHRNYGNHKKEKNP